MRFIHFVKQLYNKLLPYTCVLCHHPSQRTQDLCEPCHSEMPILTHSCQRCARELPPTLPNRLCSHCLKQPPPFDATYAAFSYKDSVTKLILNLKFNNALNNARLLGELLAKRIKEDWYQQQDLPDIIIPVPLHSKRLTERGFNQALEIAKLVAKSLKLPLETTSCQRIKFTSPQATLKVEHRLNNIKNAFLINKDFSNKHIAIIDDVITTGQTITEFAFSLKKAGAKKIDIWCCARATIEKI